MQILQCKTVQLIVQNLSTLKLPIRIECFSFSHAFLICVPAKTCITVTKLDIKFLIDKWKSNMAFPYLLLKVFKVGLISKSILRVPINGLEVKIEKRYVTLRF